MPKHSSRSNHGKPAGAGTGALGRAEHAFDDDRPFAEVRKTLHDALRLLSQHRWMFFVPFCMVACAAFIASLYFPRTYSATTSFEVRNDPVMINLPMSAGAASFKYFRNTMVRDLTSFECMSEVVEKLGLPKDAERDADGKLTAESARARDGLARAYSANVNVGVTSPSELVDIVKIGYTGPDATIGRALVDQLKKTYTRRTMAWIHEFLVKQRDYFLRESQDAREELSRAEREDTRLRLENPFVNPTDPGAISSKLAQLESERRELQIRKREYETELDGFKQLLAASEPQADASSPENLVSIESEYASQETLHLAGQIQEIQAKVVNLRDTRGMTDHHPEITALMELRRGIEAKLEDQRARDRQMAVAGGGALPGAVELPRNIGPWQSERARLLIQMAAQSTKIKDLDISLQANDRALADLNHAKDNVYEKQEEFALVIADVQKAKSRLAQAESTVATINPAIKAVEQDRLMQFAEGQPARGGSIPVSPRGITVLLLCLVAGVVAGAIFVFLAEILDHVFRSSNQVGRSLGLPILEAIDEIVTGQDRRRFLVQHAVVNPLLILVCLGITGLTGSMAYLSLTQPWTYQKLRSIPQTALHLFVEPDTTPVSAEVPEVP
jgi:uncharacterized protein involved in exopolysaccharide biosynthesis